MVERLRELHRLHGEEVGARVGDHRFDVGEVAHEGIEARGVRERNPHAGVHHDRDAEGSGRLVDGARVAAHEVDRVAVGGQLDADEPELPHTAADLLKVVLRRVVGAEGDHAPDPPRMGEAEAADAVVGFAGVGQVGAGDAGLDDAAVDAVFRKGAEQELLGHFKVVDAVASEVAVGVEYHRRPPFQMVEYKVV